MSKRNKTFLFLFSIIIVLVIGTVFINIHIINESKNQIIDIDKINEIENIDAILVLGCKVEGNSPSLMLSRRLEKAYDVYNKTSTKLLVSGDYRDKYNEVDVMRDYFLDSGVPDKDIVLDYSGVSTYDSIYRAKYVFNMKKVIIVTQNYQMYRALFLANKLDLEAVGIVASDIPQKLVMIKNEIREVFSRDKSFIYGIIKPKIATN